MKTKVCSKCKEEKEVSDFNWKQKSKGTRHSKCKPCYNAYNRKYYKGRDNTDLIAKSRARQAAIIEQYKEWKSKQCCKVCGEDATECLDLHHRDPTQKEFTPANGCYTTGSWAAWKKEIDKCDVLCANCHRKVHSGRIEYYSEVV